MHIPRTLTEIINKLQVIEDKIDKIKVKPLETRRSVTPKSSRKKKHG